MPKQAPTQNKVLKVLSDNANERNVVESPVDLCRKKLPEMNRKDITKSLRKLEDRGIIAIFKSGMPHTNGGIITSIKVLKDEVPSNYKGFCFL